jgi:ATP-dependent Clp protease adaptor protein ClpS
MADPKQGGDAQLLEATKTEKPKRYKVLVFNDDYTTMECVVHILTAVFRHSPASAHRLMIAIHRSGVGVAGVYAREIAEAKLEQATEIARGQGYPLQLDLEVEA